MPRWAPIVLGETWADCMFRLQDGKITASLGARAGNI